MQFVAGITRKFDILDQNQAPPSLSPRFDPSPVTRNFDTSRHTKWKANNDPRSSMYFRNLIVPFRLRGQPVPCINFPPSLHQFDVEKDTNEIRETRGESNFRIYFRFLFHKIRKL